MQALIPIDRFERVLAELEAVPDLKRVHDQLEAAARLAKRLRLTLVDQNRIAELRIRTARKAGTILARTVARGGKSNSHGGSSNPLPGGISWNQSSRWQQLAKIQDSVVADYLAAATEEEAEVTVAGLLRAAKSNEPHFSSASEEWYTPPHIIEAVLAVFGAIDLDPCSNAERSVPASEHFTEDDDGLSKRWRGRVYMNPPYGKVLPAWIDKLAESYECGDVLQAIALVPSRTDTALFRRLRHYPRCFLFGRLRFSGCENPAPFPSMCVYLGIGTTKFQDAFQELGDTYVLTAFDKVRKESGITR